MLLLFHHWRVNREKNQKTKKEKQRSWWCGGTNDTHILGRMPTSVKRRGWLPLDLDNFG